MAVTDYSTTPGSNTSISGINIAEGCPPSGINNALRQLMADTATAMLNGDMIADGQVDTAKLAASVVTADKLATDAVETAKIKDVNVTAAKLATDAVETAKIKDNAVTTDKLVNSAVTTDKLVNSAVTTDKLVNSAATTGKIADGAVTTDKIADGAVTTIKLADSVGANSANGGCKLFYSSATELNMSLYNGNKLNINGTLETVVSTNVSNSGLSADTLYYVYAYMDGSTMKLTLSTTPYTTGAYGVMIKTGDGSQTLVGMIYTNSSSEFSNVVGDIANYYNRESKVITKKLLATESISSSTLVELTQDLRCNFLSWGDSVQSSFTGVCLGFSAGSPITTTLCIDGTNSFVGHARVVFNGASGHPTDQPDDLSASVQVTKGRHYITLFGLGTVEWKSDATYPACGKLTVLIKI